MKVRVNAVPSITKMSDLKVGQVAKCLTTRGSFEAGKYYLAIYETEDYNSPSLINLENPSKFWPRVAVLNNIECEILPVGTEIILTTEN